MGSSVVGALRVNLSMNAGEFTSGLRSARGEYGRFGGDVQQISKNITAAFFRVTAAIAVVRGAVSAFNSVIQSAARFEGEMSNVSTLVDTATESIETMGNQVLEISRRVPVAVSDLSSALYDVRSAGIASSDAMRVLDKSSRLAVAGLGTTKEAVDLVTSSINAFNLKGRDADLVYDQIFKTVKSGKTTISDLARGFGAVAGMVAKADIELDDYLASVAALTTTGLPAAQAHTQIRAAIAGLTRETELSKKVFEAMGVKTFPELVKQSGGLGAAFQRIQNVMGGNEAAMIKLLGSVEAYNAVASLAGAQNKAYTSTLASMRDGTVAVTDAFNKQNQTMNASLQRLTNSTETFTDALGKQFAPALAVTADQAAQAADAFKSMSPAAQEATSKFVMLNVVFGPFVMGVKTAIDAIRDLVASIEIFGVSVSDTLDKIYKGLLMFSSGSFITGFDALKDKVNENDETLKKHTETIANLPQAWTTTVEEVNKVFNDHVLNLDSGTKKMTESQKLHNQALLDAKQIIQDIQTPTEALAEKQAMINRAMAEGALTATQYGRAMAQASALNEKNMSALAGAVSQNLSTIFGDSKAVAIATALINTYQGITQALAAYPPPVSYAMAAIQAAAGFAQVANIRSQTAKGGGSGGGATASLSAASSAATGVQTGAQQSLMVQGISPDAMYSGDVVRSLAQKLIDYQKDGGVVVLA